MSWEARGLPVLRVELWHGLLLAALLALAPLEWVEPAGLLLGGLFMGVNFLLLAVGIRWVITPFANKGRVRAGVFLLIPEVLLLAGSFMDVVDPYRSGRGFVRRGGQLPDPGHFVGSFLRYEVRQVR